MTVMKIIRTFMFSLILFGIGFCEEIILEKQQNLPWLPYYYTPKLKNFDFNNYIKVFAYSGDLASAEYKIYYPNVTDKCKFPGRKITFDLDVRVWLKNGTFKYYYIKKICVNASDHVTSVHCTNNNCYIIETCFLKGYKDLCKEGDEDEIFIVFNKSINIWKIDKNGNLSLIYKKTGFKSAGDGIDLDCNNNNICWAKMAPNVGSGYYVFNFNEFDNNKTKIYKVKFNKEVDSIYFIDQNHYIYHSYNGIYDENDQLIYKTKNKIVDCVIYNYDELYCLLQNITNGFINSDLVYFNLKNNKFKLLKSFPKFGLFKKIVAKGIDKKNNKIFFICQAPGLKTVDFYVFIYDIKNNSYNYIKVNSVKTGSFWEFYGKIKKYKIKNGSFIYFGFPDNEPKNNNISLSFVTIPLYYPYKIEVIDNFNKKIRNSLENTFSYTIKFNSISTKDKIPIKIYLNNNIIINKNVSNDEVVEFFKKFNDSKNVTVKICYKNNCTKFNYEIIKPKINITENKTSIQPKPKIIKNQTEKSKPKENQKQNFNILPIIICIILIIIAIIYYKRKKDQLKSDMM